VRYFPWRREALRDETIQRHGPGVFLHPDPAGAPEGLAHYYPAAGSGVPDHPHRLPDSSGTAPEKCRPGSECDGLGKLRPGRPGQRRADVPAAGAADGPRGRVRHRRAHRRGSGGRCAVHGAALCVADASLLPGTAVRSGNGGQRAPGKNLQAHGPVSGVRGAHGHGAGKGIGHGSGGAFAAGRMDSEPDGRLRRRRRSGPADGPRRNAAAAGGAARCGPAGGSVQCSGYAGGRWAAAGRLPAVLQSVRHRRLPGREGRGSVQHQRAVFPGAGGQLPVLHVRRGHGRHDLLCPVAGLCAVHRRAGNAQPGPAGADVPDGGPCVPGAGGRLRRTADGPGRPCVPADVPV